MPTAIGLMFVIAATYCFAKGADELFCLLIFSTLFNASSITSSFGLGPFYFVAFMFLARSFLDVLTSKQPQTSFKGKKLLVLFGFIGVLSAFTLPFIFAGVHIDSPKATEDELFLRPPLHFGPSNVAQAAYLVMQILIVFMAVRRRSDQALFRTTRAFWLSCYFLVAIVFIQFACLHVGVSFPYKFFQNNPSQVGAVAGVESGNIESRVMGPFSEPAAAGIVLATFAAALLPQLFAGKRKTIALLFALMALVMVRSASSLATVAFMTACVIFAYPMFRFPWFIKTTRLKRVSGLLLVVTLVALTVLASPLRKSLLSQTVDKSDSTSFVNRTTRDLNALQITSETHGFGVGLGSERPSSLVTTLLSNVGIIGFLVFTLMYIRLLSNATGENAWLRWAGYATLIDMACAGPSITAPAMWIMLALAVRLGSNNPVAAFENSSLQALPATAGLQA